MHDFWVVTSYFNPAGYESKLYNYHECTRRLRAAGLNVLTIECTFGDQPRALGDVPDTLHVRATDRLWQKERLLNLAIARLPKECTKLAWVDADVIFTNPDWALETSRWLDQVPLVQPFDTTVRLGPGEREESLASYRQRSFAAVFAEDPATSAGEDFDRHGDTGLAWAARRTLLERHGLYDACIAGGGDHLLCHAMGGNWQSACLDEILGEQSAFRTHFLRWAESFFEDVRGGVAFVPGAALHLWHGSIQDRQYNTRHRTVQSFGFDPTRDLHLGRDGCWEWSGKNPSLAEWVDAYFHSRQEDVGYAG